MRKKILSRALVPILTAALAVGAPRDAHAGTWLNGYVCGVTRFLTNSSYGTNGWLSVTIYSGTSCTGSYVGTGYLCGQGALVSGCQASLGTSESFASLLNQATHAKYYNHYVSVYIETGGSVPGLTDWSY